MTQQLEQAPELSVEMVENFLSELVATQAIAEQDAAQLIAEFMAGSPDRIFALVNQYLEAQRVPVNPKMLEFKYFGGIQINPDYLWSLVMPNSAEDVFFKVSAGLTISITLALTCNAIWPPVQTVSVQSQGVESWA